MIIKKYSISNWKVNREIKIAVFSDLHYSSLFKRRRFDDILNTLRKDKPDYICIPGDIVDDIGVLDIEDNCQELITFFKKLGSIATTFISIGNHDIKRIVNNRSFYDEKRTFKNKFDCLRGDNVILLDNEIYEIDNVRFIGFRLSFSYYYNLKSNEDLEMLVKDFNENIENFNDDKLNVLLCHSPICILDSYVIDRVKMLKNIDIVLSGHMHNGMVFSVIDGIFPKNRGIIAPNKSLYPDNARGIKKVKIDNKEITLVISGGITKLSKSSVKLLHFGDYIYRPQIEYLMIKK